MMMILPTPAWLLDIGLSISFASSIAIFMIVLFSERPLDFSSFPTMLLASLKIIAASWRNERQNQNAQEISERGKMLLEKFVSFTDDMKKIGEQLERTQHTYGDAMKKLTEGRGNLVRQATELESLGVRSRKKIDDSLITDTDIGE